MDLDFLDPGPTKAEMVARIEALEAQKDIDDKRFELVADALRLLEGKQESEVPLEDQGLSPEDVERLKEIVGEAFHAMTEWDKYADDTHTSKDRAITIAWHRLQVARQILGMSE